MRLKRHVFFTVRNLATLLSSLLWRVQTDVNRLDIGGVELSSSTATIAHR